MMESNLFPVKRYPIHYISTTGDRAPFFSLKSVVTIALQYQVWANATDVGQAICMCFLGLKSI